MTWADTVAVFTVVSERAASPGTPANDSPVIGRLVTIEIDKVVWSRAGGEQPPRSFETQAPGWYRGDGAELLAMRSESGVRMEVGTTYIAPVIYLFGQWGFDDSLLEVRDGLVDAAPNQDFALAAELDGGSVEEAAEVLSSARPVPDSGALRDTTDEQLAAIGVDLN